MSARVVDIAKVRLYCTLTSRAPHWTTMKRCGEVKCHLMPRCAEYKRMSSTVFSDDDNLPWWMRQKAVDKEAALINELAIEEAEVKKTAPAVNTYTSCPKNPKPVEEERPHHRPYAKREKKFVGRRARRLR